MISKPTLSPREGYVEVEVNGVRQYKKVASSQPEVNVNAIYDELAEAYRQGVQSAYEQQ